MSYNRYHEETRWWEYLLFLLFGSTVSAALAILLGADARGSLVLAFGIGAFLSFAAFIAEAAAMGLTAKAGGFFWFVIVSFGLCWRLTA